MDILYLPSLNGSRFSEQVWDMLCAADKEFVPPLSHRESTTQSDLTEDAGAALPKSYFEQLKEQDILLAVENDRVMGMLSYRRGLAEIQECSVYVSTIIVGKQYRGGKIAEALYEELFRLEKGWIVTRTWSQNTAHIHILKKLHFSLIKRLENHRGQGIDTVYYGKENV